MSGGVEDVDRGWDSLLKELRALDGAVVTAGVHGDQDSHLVYIATLHEFGSHEWTVTSKQAYYMARFLMGIDPDTDRARFWGTWRALKGKKMRIPERSFLRRTFDEDRALFDEAADRVLNAVLGGAPAEQTLQQFARYAEAMFKLGLMRAKPDNAALTVHVKGSDQPLVHHGRLKNSIVAYVRKRGAGDA